MQLRIRIQDKIIPSVSAYHKHNGQMVEKTNEVDLLRTEALGRIQPFEKKLGKRYRVEKSEAQTSKLDKPGSDTTLSRTSLRLREQTSVNLGFNIQRVAGPHWTVINIT